MEIEDKYVKLLQKAVYNKRLDKCGHITGIDLSCCFSPNGINVYWHYTAYYDGFDSNNILFFEDFKKGLIQFVLFDYNDEQLNDEINEKITDDIKSAFGNDFSDSMICVFSSDEWDKNNKNKDKRNKQLLSNDLVSLTEMSVDLFYKDFWIQELYKKYKKDVLTEKQMLYAIINYLCIKNKELADKNLDYFVMYELKRDFENFCDKMQESDFKPFWLNDSTDDE